MQKNQSSQFFRKYLWKLGMPKLGSRCATCTFNFLRSVNPNPEMADYANKLLLAPEIQYKRSLIQALYVLQTYLKLSLQPIFTQNKILFKIFKTFFSSLCYVTFQCRCYNIFKIILNIIFGHENIKNLPSKIAFLWQFGFCLLCSPECSKQPRIEYPFYRFLYPMICVTISGTSTPKFFHLPASLQKILRK